MLLGGLIYPHYQEVFSKFVLALETYDNRLSVFLDMRGEDYSNHFMTVRKSAEKVKPFVDRMNWMDGGPVLLDCTYPFHPIQKWRILWLRTIAVHTIN
jgi:hypothetical protein